MRSSQKPKPSPPASPAPLPYFATAAKGTEGLLRDELRALGIRPVRGDRGGVHFGGDLSDAFRVCLHSRIAIRVLELRAATEVRNSDELYQFVRALTFDDVLNPLLSLAVSASIRSSRLTHSQFVAQRVKDAVVDQQRAIGSRRSDVDLKHPDVRLYVHLVKDIATIYVDLAGESLHRRSYRLQESPAPLKETLAAALILWSGWDRSSPLLDPCCGSGTIAMEAAMIAANWAPGLRRQSFGLEHHVRIDGSWRERFAALRAEADGAIQRERAEIVTGSDIDISAVSSAQQAARDTGLPLRFSRRDVLNLAPPATIGTIVTNPPYGIRLQGGESLVRRMGESLSRFAGFAIVVLSPDATWRTALRTQPNREHTLFNGDIECRAYSWNL
jgi:23S rRNA G2445 N2-methylase RlmL